MPVYDCPEKVMTQPIQMIQPVYVFFLDGWFFGGSFFSIFSFPNPQSNELFMNPFARISGCWFFNRQPDFLSSLVVTLRNCPRYGEICFFFLFFFLFFSFLLNFFFLSAIIAVLSYRFCNPLAVPFLFWNYFFFFISLLLFIVSNTFFFWSTEILVNAFLLLSRPI